MNPARPLRFPAGLYGVTPGWADGQRLLDAVQAAIRGGMSALQLRMKGASRDAAMELGRELARVCRAAGVAFIVNDSVQTALALDADGVHIGRDDGDPRAARAALGPDKILGCSCYNQPELARAALAAGADYVAFGSMYASAVKPEAVRASFEHLAQALRLAQSWPGARQPAVVAIGGITPDNAAPLIAAGADFLAV
jgi:thiamine-phosphate pyrophosphorylase